MTVIAEEEGGDDDEGTDGEILEVADARDKLDDEQQLSLEEPPVNNNNAIVQAHQLLDNDNDKHQLITRSGH